MIVLMISFGAGVAPSDCTASCNSAGVVGRWLVGVSLVMQLSLALDLWLPGWKSRALRMFVRQRTRWSRFGQRPRAAALLR